jgi:outer membrane protein OmpA-like peptidoglycan-associated protein
VVTLTGDVGTETARTAAAEAIQAIAGVTSVTNEIVVADESATGQPGTTINEILDLDPITFAVNSADITPEGQAVLAGAVEFMKANPGVNVEIGGHTDSDGDDAFNLALSQERADSVKAFLVAEGVEADRMSTRGYGEAEPKVANDSPANKAINRRIEFTIQ